MGIGTRDRYIQIVRIYWNSADLAEATAIIIYSGQNVSTVVMPNPGECTTETIYVATFNHE